MSIFCYLILYLSVSCNTSFRLNYAKLRFTHAITDNQRAQYMVTQFNIAESLSQINDKILMENAERLGRIEQVKCGVCVLHIL